jgi:hypothetical protein
MLTDWRSRPVVVCSEVCPAAAIALRPTKAIDRNILLTRNIEKVPSKKHQSARFTYRARG